VALTDLPAFSSLAADQIAAARAELAQRLAELFPEYETSRGALADVVVRAEAVILAAIRTVLDDVQNSSSLLAILSNPDLAVDELVDRVLSNYRLPRLSAQAASGTVSIIVDSLTPVVIATGTTFAAGGVSFVTQSVFVARTDLASVTSVTDRVLSPISGGRYRFDVPVVATTTGLAGMLRRGQLLELTTPLLHVIGIYAAEDFQGGFDAESNTALIQRLQDGAAAATTSNRMTIRSLIRRQADFAALTAVSVVGFGDVEMLRDKRTLLPVALGGRVDLYARTADLPVTRILTVTATYQGADPINGGGIWQFSLGRDAFPGFWDVRSVLPADAVPTDSGYVVLTDERGLDLTGTGVPDIEIGQPGDGVYSRYQTAVVTFLDTDTPTAGLTAEISQATYQVMLRGLPQIDALQTFLGDRDRIDPAGDMLVRSAVPCDVSLTVLLFRPAASSEPDFAALAVQLASRVNGSGEFSGRLAVASLIPILASGIPAGWQVGDVSVSGIILRPEVRRSSTTSSTTFLRPGSSLLVPDDPGRGVSPRTVCFFLDPQSVTFTVRPLGISGI
jgi:hypothetical protein